MSERGLTIRVHMPGGKSLLMNVSTVPNPGWTMMIDKAKYQVIEVCQTPNQGHITSSLDVHVKHWLPSEYD